MYLKIKKLKVDNLTCSNREKDKIEYLQGIAIQRGYWIRHYYAKSSKIIFEQKDVVISINLKNNSTIITLYNHPKYKESKKKIESLDLYQVGNVLKNPRLHTGLGVFITKINKDGDLLTNP